MAINTVSILDRGFKLEEDNSVIDFNWYYGCLFSPSKQAGHHSVGGNDGNERKNCCNGSITENGEASQHYKESNGRAKAALDGNDDNRRKDCCNGSIVENGEASQHYKESNGSYPSFVDKKCKMVDGEGGACLIASTASTIFSVLDENGDERVSMEEILKFLERLNLEMPMEDLELAVKSVSKCTDNFLTSMEFVDFYRSLLFEKDLEDEDVVSDGDDCEIDDKAISEAFGVFDQNGDGFINALELSDVLCRLGFVEGRDVSYCQSMIETVDFNGDGFVDLHEFRHLITRSSFSSSPSALVSFSS